MNGDVAGGSASDPLREPGVAFEERWIAVQGGVRLRALQWRPAERADAAPVMFVAGWVSVLEGWLPVLRSLVRRRPVVYLETREKGTAQVDTKRLRPEEFTVARLAQDLINAADVLGADQDRAVWFGSSMGANAILEALKGGRLPGRGAFLVGPNASFKIPWWGRPLLHLPAWSYHAIKYFVIWYVRRFRVDARAEPEQMQRYERTLHAAEPLRLKLSARAVRGYAAWPDLDTITAPVAIAYAPTDTLHSEQEVRAIVSLIPNGRAVECRSNAYMHDRRVVDDLERFIRSLGAGNV